MVHSEGTGVNVGQNGEESLLSVVMYGFLHDVLPPGWRSSSVKHIMDLREAILSSNLHTIYVPRVGVCVLQRILSMLVAIFPSKCLGDI